MSPTPPPTSERWWLAMVGGLCLAVGMLVAASWATITGQPVLWLWLGPWAFVGLLLVVWGWQRRPRR